MNGSGEESPDWLRSFQVPGQIALSSGSQSPIIGSPLSDDDDDEDSINLSKLFKKKTASVPEGKNNKDAEDSILNKASEDNSPDKKEKVELTPSRKRKKGSESEEVGKSTDRVFTKRRRALEKPPAHNETNHSVWMLSSDSESCGNDSSIKVEEVLDKELLVDDAKPTKGEENDDLASMKKSPKKQAKKEEQKKKKKLETQMKGEKDDKDVVEENLPDKDVLEESLPEKHNGPHVSSSRLPLLLPEKVQRTKALVECEGDSIDLSGDVGAVGRIVISDNPSGNHEMLFDLKGTIYKTAILPSRTFCVVSFGQSEAKVEAIMNDFIQLKPQSNVYEAETMVEGTLDGYSFDSDEEDNLPRAAAQGDQNENVEDQPNMNVKPKAKKSSAMEQKKRKTGGKLPKKVKKKPQASKKSKGKK